MQTKKAFAITRNDVSTFLDKNRYFGSCAELHLLEDKRVRALEPQTVDLKCIVGRNCDVGVASRGNKGVL